MSDYKITIDNIFDGVSPTQYYGAKGSYNSAIGVDPDFSFGTQIKTSGMPVPTVYEKFSGTGLTGYPKWITTNPKEANVYVYSSTGNFLRYSSALASETALTSPTAGAGNGMAYYNNYIYLATPTNVARYGPMNGTPAFAQNAWTSAILGTQTALGNFTYPTIRGNVIPNHPMHQHGDQLYFGDVVDGAGVLHSIRTRTVAAEGDTNDDSAYNVLDLPIGYIPTDIESYGTDLVVLAMQTSSTSINQGKAALFFWDTFDDSFFNQVDLTDPIATALLNVNGSLFIWSGNAQAGVRLSQYIGGDSVREIAFLEEGFPPFAGAVDALGSRVVWGSFTTYPTTSASVWAYGSKSLSLPRGLHNVVKTTSTGANQNVTCLKYAQQANNSRPRIIVGWGDDSAKGLDKLSATGTYSSVWRSKNFVIGDKFLVKRLTLRFGETLAANMSLVPKLIIDDSTVITLDTINNTNFSGREAVYKNPNLNAAGARGDSTLMVELNWAGTVELPVLLPITMELEIFDDEEAK